MWVRTISRGEQIDRLDEALEHATVAARAASSKDGIDVVVLEMTHLLGITDYFVICSGRNERHVSTLTDEVTARLRDAGRKPYRVEGDREQRWVLLDYLDFVVHVFHTEEREFYDLERLWRDAPRISVELGELAAEQG